MDEGYVLVGDIGGTNGRLALSAPDGTLSEPVSRPTREFEDLAGMIRAYLDVHRPRDGAVTGAAICAAGPVLDGVIEMTNSPWVVSVAGLAEATGVAHPILLNDFTAAALGVPHMPDTHLRRIAQGEPDPLAPIGVLGPGTGLGVSGLIPDQRGGYLALSGEGGHVTLAATTRREAEVVERLQDRFGHVSVERVCSGPGLETLYDVLGEIDGTPAPTGDRRLDAAAVAGAAADGDARAAEAVHLFTGWLGATAGNLALTLGALGGVYVAGGIVARWNGLFDAARFNACFEAKGRFADYLARIPRQIVTGGQPALLGLAEAARRARDRSGEGPAAVG